MTKPLEINVDLELIAKAWDLPVKDVIGSITGTTLSAIMESKVAKVLGGTRVEGKQLAWDVETPHRKYKKIEVRNICAIGGNVPFAPSTATGKGRKFDEQEFFAKLDAIDSYVFCDMRKRLQEPVKLYEIPASHVRELYLSGVIGIDLHKRGFERPHPHGNLSQVKFFKRFSVEEYGLKA
jgi:hypothetical protein|tara:strand:- start:232 stop:771 length:540 start_codon:yes stop_codon:yes gene_type:complete